ncbi:MAG: SWIM zinc finger family protein [Acidiferrobacter sp.]
MGINTRWRPYVPVARRRAHAARGLQTLRENGTAIEPIAIHGQKIARSFWGVAWCRHIEGFSDHANRLPRGRTYVRNGAVGHLAISRGTIAAVVSGSALYHIAITIDPLPRRRWQHLIAQCTGEIGSLLELLQGRFSDRVMAIVTDRAHGLFPEPADTHFSCSCPDGAVMCKHVAAVLYGVGARLDERPELLFVLRGVDHDALITAGIDAAAVPRRGGTRRRLATTDLAGVFGVAIDTDPQPTDEPQAGAPSAAIPTPVASACQQRQSPLRKGPATVTQKKTTRKRRAIPRKKP